MQCISTTQVKDSIYVLRVTVFNSCSAYLLSAEDTLTSFHFCKLFHSNQIKKPHRTWSNREFTGCGCNPNTRLPPRGCASARHHAASSYTRLPEIFPVLKSIWSIVHWIGCKHCSGCTRTMNYSGDSFSIARKTRARGTAFPEEHDAQKGNDPDLFFSVVVWGICIHLPHNSVAALNLSCLFTFPIN